MLALNGILVNSGCLKYFWLLSVQRTLIPSLELKYVDTWLLTGKSTIFRYLKTFSEDCCPVSYLNKSVLTENAIWATTVEIMAFLCLMDSDVYVATTETS